MRTLRVKLVVPGDGSRGVARAVFDELSEIHADQSIFQVNQTRYVGDGDWGFQIRYETEIHTRDEFVQSTSLAELERAMARVGPESFERRVEED
jgi:hypothetical protein